MFKIELVRSKDGLKLDFISPSEPEICSRVMQFFGIEGHDRVFLECTIGSALEMDLPMSFCNFYGNLDITPTKFL